MSISIFEVWTWEVWEEVSPEETVELILEPLIGGAACAFLALVGDLTVIGDHARRGHDGVRAHLHG